MIKNGIFNNDNIKQGKRYQYFTNSDGSRFYMQYFEYFETCGWQSYLGPEEITEEEYREAMSIHVNK